MLVVAAILGVAAGFGIDQLLTASARPAFTPSYMLPVFLVLLGVAVVTFALPIRRAVRGIAGGRVDPFRAVRIAMLARASSIMGAAVGGVGAGLALFLLTRPVPPPLGSVLPGIATALAGVALVAAGLAAEHMCTIHKDDDDEPPAPDAPERITH